MENLTFYQFKTECKRLVYEADQTNEKGKNITVENIRNIDKFEDLYISYYGEGMTPEEANKEQSEINIDDYYHYNHVYDALRYLTKHK